MKATKKFLPFITSVRVATRATSVRSFDEPNFSSRYRISRRKKIPFDRVADYFHSRHVGR